MRRTAETWAVALSILTGLYTLGVILGILAAKAKVWIACLEHLYR